MNNIGTVFAVLKVGIYQHDIFGVFETKEGAITTAKKLAADEIDKYHSFDVEEVAFNNTGKIVEVQACGQFCENIVVFSCRKETK